MAEKKVKWLIILMNIMITDSERGTVSQGKPVTLDKGQILVLSYFTINGKAALCLNFLPTLASNNSISDCR